MQLLEAFIKYLTKISTKSSFLLRQQFAPVFEALKGTSILKAIIAQTALNVSNKRYLALKIIPLTLLFFLNPQNRPSQQVQT